MRLKTCAATGRVCHIHCDTCRRTTRTARRPRGNRPEIRRAVLIRDNYTCQGCGHHDQTGRTLQVDHIRRVADGGTDRLDNLRTLCTIPPHRCHDPN